MAKKLLHCHYEVVEMRSPYITDKGLYIQQNSVHVGYEGELPTGPIDKIAFPHRGPNAILWLLRNGRITGLATRKGNAIISSFDGVFSGIESGVVIPQNSHLLRASDGLIVIPPGLEWGPGQFDTTDGRPRPTFYVEESTTVPGNPCTFIEELPRD